MKKILIAEDDEMISAMYKIKLTQDGYDVVLAVNGLEAVEIAKKEKPDLILLDIIMPAMDGFSALQEIRQNNLIKTPIVMLTNLGTDEDKIKAKEMGANGYLIKASMTPAEVSVEVKKYLNNN